MPDSKNIHTENKVLFCNVLVAQLSGSKACQHLVFIAVLRHPYVNFLIPRKLTINSEKEFLLERGLLSKDTECKFLHILSQYPDKEKGDLIQICNNLIIDSCEALFGEMKILLSLSYQKVFDDDALLNILLQKFSQTIIPNYYSDKLKQFLFRLLYIFLTKDFIMPALLEGSLLELLRFPNLIKAYLQDFSLHLSILSKCLKDKNEEFFQKYIKICFKQMSLMDSSRLSNNLVKLYVSDLKQRVRKKPINKNSIEARFAFLIGEALPNELDPNSEYFQENQNCLDFREILEFYESLFHVFSCSPPVVRLFAIEFLLYTYNNPVTYANCISEVSQFVIQWMNPSLIENFILDVFFNSTFDLFPFSKNPPSLIIKKIESAELFFLILTRCSNPILLSNHLLKFMTSTKGSFTNLIQISDRVFAELCSIAVLQRSNKNIVIEVVNYLFEALLFSPTKRKMFEFIGLIERFDFSNTEDVTYVKMILDKPNNFLFFPIETDWFVFKGWREEGIQLTPIPLPSGFGVFFVFRLERKDHAESKDSSSHCLLHLNNRKDNSLIEIGIAQNELYYLVKKKGKSDQILLSHSITEDKSYFLLLCHVCQKVFYRLDNASLESADISVEYESNMDTWILGSNGDFPLRGIMSSVYFFKADSEEINDISALLKTICSGINLSSLLHLSPHKLKTLFSPTKEENYFNFLSKIFLYISPLLTPEKNMKDVRMYHSADNKTGKPFPVRRRECEVVYQRSIIDVFIDCGHFTMLLKFLYKLPEVNTLSQISKEELIDEIMKLIYMIFLSQNERLYLEIKDKEAWNALQFCLRRISQKSRVCIKSCSTFWTFMFLFYEQYPHHLADFLDGFALNLDTLYHSSESINKIVSILSSILDNYINFRKEKTQNLKQLELDIGQYSQFILRKLLELLKYYTYKDEKEALSNLEDIIFQISNRQLTNSYHLILHFFRTDQQMASPRLLNSLLNIMIMLFESSRSVLGEIILKEIEISHRCKLLERIISIIDLINSLHSISGSNIEHYLCLNPKLRFNWGNTDLNVCDQIIASSSFLLYKFDWTKIKKLTLKFKSKHSKESEFLSCISQLCTIKNAEPCEILQEMFSIKSNLPYLGSKTYCLFYEFIFSNSVLLLDSTNVSKSAVKSTPNQTISQPLLLKILLSNLDKFTRSVLEKLVKDFLLLIENKDFLQSVENCITLDHVVLEIVQNLDNNITGSVKLLGFLIHYLGEKNDWKTLKKVIQGIKKSSILSLEVLYYCLEEIYRYSQKNNYNKKGFSMTFRTACVLEELTSQKNETILGSSQYLVCISRLLEIFHKFNTLYISSPYFYLDLSQEPLKHRNKNARPEGGIIRIVLKLLLNGIKYDKSEELLSISLLTFYIFRQRESKIIVKRLAAFRIKKCTSKHSLVPWTTKYNLTDIMFKRKKEVVKCHEEICKKIEKIQSQYTFFKLQPKIEFSQTLFECTGFTLYLLCGEIINLVYNCIFPDMAQLKEISKEERYSEFSTILKNKENYQQKKLQQLSHLLAMIIIPEELRVHEVVRILKQTSSKMERWLEEKNKDKISSVHSIILNSFTPGWTLSQPPLEVCFQVVQRLLNEISTFDLPESNCQNLLNIILTEEFYNYFFPNLLLVSSQNFEDIDIIIEKDGLGGNMIFENFEKGNDYLNDLRKNIVLSLKEKLPDEIQIHEEKVEWAEAYCRKSFEKCSKRRMLENDKYKIPEQIILYAQRQYQRRYNSKNNKKNILTSLNNFQRQFFKLSSHRDSLGRAMLLRPQISFTELKKNAVFIRIYMLKKLLIYKMFDLPSPKTFFSFLQSISYIDDTVDMPEQLSLPLLPLKSDNIQKDSNQFTIYWIKSNGYLHGQLTFHMNYLTLIRYKNDSILNGVPPYPETNGRVINFINYVDIIAVFQKRFTLLPRAVELYFRNGKSMFLVFLNHKFKVAFLTKLQKFTEENKKIQFNIIPEISFQKSGFTNKWVNGQMSNFEYLMALNKFGGRTFLDIGQYPVFPWVIEGSGLFSAGIEKATEGSKNKLRNLSLSIAGYTKDKRDAFDSRFRHIFRVQEKSITFSAQSIIQHYSAPVNVIEFLQRLEPFSFCKATNFYSKKNFIFNSFSETWLQAIYESSTNCELIPELFYLPQLFLSSNFLNLLNYKTQIEGMEVSLPLCARNAHEFVQTQLQALESEEVSEQLDKWINMIFTRDSRYINNTAHQPYLVMWDEEFVSNNLLIIDSEYINNIHIYGSNPIVLIEGIHPKRNMEKIKTNANNSIFLQKEGNILLECGFIKDSTIINILQKETKLYAILKDGSLISITKMKLNSKKDSQKLNSLFFKDILSSPIDLGRSSAFHNKFIVYSNYLDNFIHVCNIDSHSFVESFAYHSGRVTCIHSCANNYLYSASQDGTIAKWEFFAGSFQLVWVGLEHEGQISSLDVNYTLDLIASVCPSTHSLSLRIISTNKLHLRISLDSGLMQIPIVRLSDRGYVLVVARDNASSTLLVYSINGEEIKKVSVDFLITSIVMEPNLMYRFIAAGSKCFLSEFDLLTLESFCLYDSLSPHLVKGSLSMLPKNSNITALNLFSQVLYIGLDNGNVFALKH